MALEQTIIKTNNTIGRFTQTVQTQALILIYGPKEDKEVELIDFNDEDKKKSFLEALPKINKQPSLSSITKTLQVINTYDICNPLNFAVGQLTKPGTKIGDILSSTQGKISEVVNIFRGFNITNSTQERIAFVSPTIDLETGEVIDSMPFQTLNKVGLIVPFTGNEIINKANIISKGSYVTLTQTDDFSKSVYYLKGTIDTSFRATTPISGMEYVINIDSMGPISEPPYQTDIKGNLIKDSVGRPIPKQFFNWKIESESKPSSDIRELSDELQNLTNALREIGIADLANELANLPPSLPGIGNLQKSLSDVNDIINNTAIGVAGVANDTGTASLLLSGNLNAENVILRVRILRDFYQKILPFTNISFAIQELFKKQIESINNVLRNAIPYEQLSKAVKFIALQSRNVLGVINLILAGLKIINSAIRIVMVVLKVVKVILKIIRLVIKIVPARWSTVGKIETITNKIKKWEEGIQKVIDILKNVSNNIRNLIGTLSLVRRYLITMIFETSRLAAKLESCKGYNDKDLSSMILEASRNNFEALKNLIKGVPQVENVGIRGEAGSDALENGFTTFVFGPGGTILPLKDSVFGFDEVGNLIFYGDLISKSTGINFENTFGQEFRSKLKYYTFNKFKTSQRELVEFADNAFLKNQKIADPEDIFGNFQELFLGYTLKIQEEKPLQSTKQTLLRRRGIALSSTEKIITSTDLTFATDLQGIINELKFKLSQDLNQGLIGINTTDSGNNEITNDDALNVASGLGVNPIGLNNEKATSNNKASSNIAGQSSQIDITPTETRIGNTPFFSEDENDQSSSTITNNNSTLNKNINMESLISSATLSNDENPELLAIRGILDTIGSINPTNISEILSGPNNENLTDEELISKLKSSILSSIDPNPDKVEEVKRKTQQWYEGLQKQTKIDWERLFQQNKFKKLPTPPYETYYNNIETAELPKWVKLLLRNRYTQTEIDYGISQDKIRDKYKITILDSGNVEVELRS